MKNKFEVVLKWIGLVVFVALVGGAVVALPATVIHPYSDYLSNKDDLVAVEATVTDIYEYEDSDDDDCYQIYISYQYDGESYENIYWETIYSDKLRVGEDITVEISSVNPEYIRKTNIGSGAMSVVMLVIAISVAVLIYESGFYKKKYTGDKKRITTKMVMWELGPKVALAFVNTALGYAVGMLGSSVFSPDLVEDADFAVWILAGGIAWLIVLLLRTKNIGEKGYSISIHRCLNKWSESDGDSTSYYATFENIPGKSHGGRVYDHSEIGRSYYVLCNKNGDVKEVYDTSGWILDVSRDDFENTSKKIAFKMCVCAVTAVVSMFLISLAFEVIARLFAL